MQQCSLLSKRMTMYKSVQQFDDFKKRLHTQAILIDCQMELVQGEKQYVQAIEIAESMDIDLLYDAIDSFKRSISLAFEVDVEIEAKSSAFLGKVFYKAF